MFYLLTALIDSDEQQAEMAGILQGQATMQTHLVNLSFYSAFFPDGELRGHAFHHSKMGLQVKASAQTQPARTGSQIKSFFYSGRLTISYIHWYLPSNSVVAAALIQP